MVTTPQVAERTGASYRQLDEWTKQGYLNPVGGVGSGHARDWPAEEIRVADEMGWLTRGGMLPGPAHKLARKDLAREVIAVMHKAGLLR